MTTDEARDNIGAGVVYRPHPAARAEDGVIVSVNPSFVMVLYRGDLAPKATRAQDLHLLIPSKESTS